MKVNFTSRHFKLHETLQQQIKEKLETLDKYNGNILHVDVILYFERAINSIKTCELNVKLRNKLLIAKETSEDFAKSADRAIDRMSTQLSKIHAKKKDIKRIAKQVKYASRESEVAEEVDVM